MAQPGADWHQGKIAVRKGAHHPSAAADLPVELLYHIVGSDADPMLTGSHSIDDTIFKYAEEMANDLVNWSYISNWSIIFS